MFAALAPSSEGQDGQTKSDHAAPSADYMRALHRDRYFRASEKEFINRDLNGNLVIDEDEWVGILEEERAKFQTSNVSAERFAALDLDRDGDLTDAEIDVWIREGFNKRIRLYVTSEVFKQRKAEYEKSNGSESNP